MPNKIGDGNLLHEKRHKLENTVKKLIRSKEWSIAKVLVDCHAELHLGAAVGMSYAIAYIDTLKGVMGDDLIAALIYGGVARGLKDDKMPKDIDVLIVTKDHASVPDIKKHRRIEILIYKESIFDEEAVKEDSPEGAFKRTILSLPILCLHGCGHIDNLRNIAKQNLKISDLNQFLDSQTKKEESWLRSVGREVPSWNELKKIVAEKIELSDAVRELLFDNNEKENKK